MPPFDNITLIGAWDNGFGIFAGLEVEDAAVNRLVGTARSGRLFDFDRH